VLATHQPLDEALVDELVTTLTAGQPDSESEAATPPPAGRHTPRRRKNG
jgi:hypothetical protein